MVKSASRRLNSPNVVKFRHPLMFTSEEMEPLYPEYIQARDEYVAKRTAVILWERDQRPVSIKGPKPNDPAEPKLSMYENTPRDNYWVIRRNKMDADDEKIRLLQQMSQIDWPVMVADYIADPAAVVAKMQETQRATLQAATVVGMTVEWSGPYFTVGKNWRLDAKKKPKHDAFTVEDETGSGKKEEAETVHPFNGQLMPVDTDWVVRLDPEVIDAASMAVASLNPRRSPSEEIEFPENVVAPDDAADVPDTGGEEREAPRPIRRAKAGAAPRGDA